MSNGSPSSTNTVDVAASAQEETNPPENTFNKNSQTKKKLEDMSVEELQKEKLIREVIKLDTEKEKAAIEVKDLKRPPFFRAAFITVLGPAILSLFGALMSLYFSIYSPQIKKLENANKEIADKNNQLEKLNQEITDKTAKTNELSKQNTDSQKELNRLNLELADVQRQSSQLRLEKDKMDDQLKVITASAIFEQRKLDEALRQQARLEKEIADLNQREAELKERIAIEELRAEKTLLFRIMAFEDASSHFIDDLFDSINSVNSVYKDYPQYSQRFNNFIEEEANDPELNPLERAFDYWLLINITDNQTLKKRFKLQLFNLGNNALLGSGFSIKNGVRTNYKIFDTIGYRIYSPKSYRDEKDRFDAFTFLLDFYNTQSRVIRWEMRPVLLDDFFIFPNIPRDTYNQLLAVAIEDFKEIVNVAKNGKENPWKDISRRRSEDPLPPIYQNKAIGILIQRVPSICLALAGDLLARSDLDEKERDGLFGILVFHYVNRMFKTPDNADQKSWAKWKEQNKDIINSILNFDPNKPVRSDFIYNP